MAAEKSEKVKENDPAEVPKPRATGFVRLAAKDNAEAIEAQAKARDQKWKQARKAAVPPEGDNP